MTAIDLAGTYSYRDHMLRSSELSVESYVNRLEGIDWWADELDKLAAIAGRAARSEQGEPGPIVQAPCGICGGVFRCLVAVHRSIA